MIKEAVIFAAGEGKRLMETAKLEGYMKEILDYGIPKPLLPVPRYGKPILVWILEEIYRKGISKAIIVINPKKEEIFRKILIENDILNIYGSFDVPNIRIKFAYQNEPKGTGDALYIGSKYITSEYFLVLNGDDLVRLPELYEERTIFVYEVTNSRQYGSVIIDGKYVREIREKTGDSNIVYTGASIWNIKDLSFYFNLKEVNGEKRITDLINLLICNGKKFVWRRILKWIPINTYEQWVKACKLVKHGF